MGILVSAAEAGRLVDRHERIVRWHRDRGDLPNARKGPRGAWLIDVDDLARIEGWTVDRERLAQLELGQRRTAGGMVARLEALERRVRELEARLTAQRDRQAAVPLSGDVGYPQPSESPYSASQGHSAQIGLSEDARHILSDYPTARTVALADRGAGAPLRFKTKTDAARWLGRHGINETTPKTWQGWPPDELTPAAALSFALDLQRNARAAGNWRVSWSLRRCDDALCVCRELLDG